MSQKPTIEELENPALYKKVLTLHYGDTATFVMRKLGRAEPPMIAVWATLLLSLFLIVWYWPGVIYRHTAPQPVRGLVTGLVLMPLLLIPLHEALHIIPLKLKGARNIRWGADLSQGIIYVTAHRFVIDRRGFALLAMAPLVIITLILLTAFLLSPQWWKWVISLTLFVHTTMCAGDAALLGYMMSLGQSRVFTWDDADAKEAYFLVSLSEEGVGETTRNDG